MKKYKECAPEQTVERIKSILENVGIETKVIEEHVNDNMFYSCRIVVTNNGMEKLNIGSNGKGASYMYSLASGYAELLERLQNRMLLYNTHLSYVPYLETMDTASIYRKRVEQDNLTIEFLYDPDEEVWTCEDVLEKKPTLVGEIFSWTKSTLEVRQEIMKSSATGSFTMVPFYSVHNNEVEALPYELIFDKMGSNGMCAGNTPIEAILQGLCEIFERYSAKKIYDTHLPLPTIPIDFFEGTEAYSMIKQLIDDNQYRVVVKDCSWGSGIPVLGVLIIDPQSNTYNFSMGADFVPHIALERCLTEIHQNTTGFLKLPYNFYDIGCRAEDKNNTSETRHFKKAMTHGTGQWPTSIFYSAQSDKFDGFESILGKSNETDLKYALNYIMSLGHRVYIRDNSFLGFPAYHIVIPGMSEIKYNRLFNQLYSPDFKALSVVKNLKHLNACELRDVVNIFENNYLAIKTDGFRPNDLFFYNISDDILNLEVDMLLFIINVKTENYNKAVKYLSTYLKDKSRLENEFFFALLDGIKMLYIDKVPEIDVEAFIRLCYSEETASDVLVELFDLQGLVDNNSFPSCFECQMCTMSYECKVFDVMKLEKDLNTQIKNNNILQVDLAKVVNCVI